jgi:regulator of PEP synthase PpsR (kinase-PPPase family)
MVSIFLAMLIFRAINVPLVATRDPRVPEALSYHNIIV